MNSRALAATLLEKVLPRQGANKSLSEVLNISLEQNEALVKEFCFGVLRWLTKLQAIANLLLLKPFKAKDADINWLLLIGLYQLLYLRIPDHAATSETVEAARQLNKQWACAVLNGSLRRFLREKESLLAQLSQQPYVQTAHPSWLVEQIKAAHPDHWQTILIENNRQAPMTLRVNRLKATRHTYLDLLNQHLLNDDPVNVSAAECTEPTQAGAFALLHGNAGIQLNRACNVSTLPHFADGWVSVQDEAAQLASLFLNPQPLDRVLDACSAPGGKTCHLLELCPDIAELVSIDVSAQRLSRVHQNLQRLELNANVVCADLSNLSEWWNGVEFDRVLLDVPCSATGVIRRHPDIKWLRRKSDITALAEQQLQLLTTVWSTLKVGGELLYCTCSILPMENKEVILAFLKQQKEATVVELDKQNDFIPFDDNVCKIEKIDQMTIGIQLFPKENGHDGFFYAKLKKQDPSRHQLP